ncbi:MAG TPA: Gfo/Idh/MocA family oxidoreductase [Baekduia sp.]|uniref:Gfo/Idh/MocA family protein n=1 Tax=Baekduia sp. TaxID=2600305 RepID=UPI002D766C25|nr:Gfo/Idh/MocA family oxidoreductase [Baekduia sp.]HET6509517.1 Gfo/Idh/MocA family oxidoreductase [Baekduia sp.]
MTLRVGVIGCGLIGRKRAQALDGDALVGCYDVDPDAARALAAGFPDHAPAACATLDDLWALAPDVVVVAVTHDRLAELSVAALEHGAHVLVEKPAAISVAQVDAIEAAADAAGRRVKVGFNHRFHPGIMRAVTEARSGVHGDVLLVRGRYGHGGRLGMEDEWRCDARRSGGGEIVDQGMHLLDLTHWLLGPLPLHSALLRTQFWDTAVDDNAALLLGVPDDRTAPWAQLHVTWTEWKNLFSLEIYCRAAKLHVEGLVRSYGPQTLTIYKMRPELGPPDVERLDWPDEDVSWLAEWRHFRAAIAAGTPVLGDLADARFGWETIEKAYEMSGYAGAVT